MTETHVCCYYYDEQHNRCKCYVNENLDALLVENAKLRGLVHELYEIAQPEAPSMFETEFADRMRELGVEVDG